MRLKRKFALLAFILLFFTSPIALGQDHPTLPAAREILEYTPASGELKPLYDEHQRDELVSKVRNYCQSVFDSVPRNSPSEQEWLSEEFSSGDMNRRARAADSVEMARNRVVSFAERCKELIDIYDTVREHPDQYVMGKTEILIELGRTFYGEVRSAPEIEERIGSDIIPGYELILASAGDALLVASTQAAIDRRDTGRD